MDKHSACMQTYQMFPCIITCNAIMLLVLHHSTSSPCSPNT